MCVDCCFVFYCRYLFLSADAIYFGIVLFFSELAGKQDPPTAEHKGSPLRVILWVLVWPVLIALHFYQLFWM